MSAALAPAQALVNLQNEETNNDRLGGVASENRICSQIGIDLLKAGGNAADAVRSRSTFPRAQLTVCTACRDHSLHWRGRSAIRPKMPYNTAERTQIVIIAE